MNQRVRRVLPALAVVAVVSVVLWLTVFRDGAAEAEMLVSGTVEATESHLGFQAPGRIETIAVREGDRVARGDELARIDQVEARARLDQATAQVAVARAALTELLRGFRPEEIAQARAARDAARARWEDARRDLDRTRILHEGRAVSREAYDKAMMMEQVARSQSEQAEEQARLLEAGPRRERIEAQRSQLAGAEASVRAIEAGIANLTVVAPSKGIVTIRHREPGEIVPAGAAVLTVMDPGDRWVRIYVKEDRIGAVSLGLPATIRSDTYPERSYAGEVVFIGSEAEFTPKNVQTPEERVKLVYAVKVRITGDSTLELKPGMPADVRLEIPTR